MLDHHFDIHKDTPAEAGTRRRLENAWVTDRTLSQYEDTLEIDFDEMVGMKVLDMGAGSGNTFAKEAAEKGVDVVSISSGFKEWQGDGKPSVFARAQQMPFADSSFDCVVSLFTVPLHLLGKEVEYASALAEAIRVLKPGGRAYFSPILDTNRRLLMRVLKKLNPDVCSYHLDRSTTDKFARLELIKK